MDRDWDLVCRVCLTGNDADGLVSLFDCDENRELLKDKYLFCSDIEVEESEPLPSHICLVCVDRLLSAYQFKRQCIASNDTLKECLSEFQQPQEPRVETLAVKQENGCIIHYEIPIDNNARSEWQSGASKQSASGEKPKKSRGRPRKYPDAHGVIEPSPYVRKKEHVSKTVELIVETTTVQDTENLTEDPPYVDDDTVDPDYVPDLRTEDRDSDDVLQLTLDPERGSFVRILKKSDGKANKRKNNSKKQSIPESIKMETEIKEEDDILLQETIMANTEPIPDSLINPQPKEKKKSKKTYKYDRVHTCDQCGSSFKSNSSLQAHIRRHLGIKPYTCKLCGYSCVLNMELRRHMMRHTGQKPYKCRICDRVFGDFGSRQKHERLHMGVRPYQCTVCGKSFTYSYVLANHMLTHTGEKKYSCVPCNKRFTKAHHLKYHNKIHHKDLYLQQQLLQEAKKIHHINISNLTTVCTEQLLGLNQDGTIQIEGISRDIDGQEIIGTDDKSLYLIETPDVNEDSKNLSS